MSADDIKACCPAPNAPAKAGGTTDTQSAVMSKKLWPVGKNFTYYFLDGTQNQKDAVTNTIPIWVNYANVSFDKTSQRDTADIRISFAQKGSWSTVGTDAGNITTKTDPTMNLGWIADVKPPSAEDAGTILHEFGHALGMMHEHQSPARGERIHLKELAVYQYYRPLLNNDDKLVKTQVIDQYNLSTVSNFSHLDVNSIMMYFMPGSLNREGIDIPVNLALSDLDKAFITLNYPRQEKDVPKDAMTTLKALNIAGVPDNVSGAITGFIAGGELEKARAEFSKWNIGVMQLHAINKLFLSSVDPSAAVQSGILDKFKKVIDHPLFKGTVKHIINGVLTSRAIPTVASIPGTAQSDVMNTIGAMITTPAFSKTVYDINTEFTGLAIQPVGPGPVSVN